MEQEGSHTDRSSAKIKFHKIKIEKTPAANLEEADDRTPKFIHGSSQYTPKTSNSASRNLMSNQSTMQKTQKSPIVSNTEIPTHGGQFDSFGGSQVPQSETSTKRTPQEQCLYDLIRKQAGISDARSQNAAQADQSSQNQPPIVQTINLKVHGYRNESSMENSLLKAGPPAGSPKKLATKSPNKNSKASPEKRLTKIKTTNQMKPPRASKMQGEKSLGKQCNQQLYLKNQRPKKNAKYQQMIHSIFEQNTNDQSTKHNSVGHLPPQPDLCGSNKQILIDETLHSPSLCSKDESHQAAGSSRLTQTVPPTASQVSMSSMNKDVLHTSSSGKPQTQAQKYSTRGSNADLLGVHYRPSLPTPGTESRVLEPTVGPAASLQLKARKSVKSATSSKLNQSGEYLRYFTDAE